MEQPEKKVGFFKRLFEDLYEVTIIYSNGKKKVYMFKEINKKSNTLIKGRDENGHEFEISTPEPFTFIIKKLY